MSTLTRHLTEASHAQSLVRRLASTYAERHSAEHVAKVVADAHQRLADARVRTYVPIFAERIAREVLNDSAAPGSDEGTRLTPLADASARRRRPPAVWGILALLTILGTTAIAGGSEMIVFRSGNEYLPRRWLDQIPLIDSWLVPGLVLGVVFGLGALATAYGLLRLAWWSRWATLLLGFGMITWIGLEITYLPDRSWLELVYGLLGVLLVLLPLMRGTRNYYSAQ